MLNKLLKIFAVLCVAFVILALSLSQHADGDMYGHIAAGNVIAHHGILYKDVFISQGKESYEWVPFEWGFEYSIYEWVAHLGLASYTLFICICTLAQVGLLYLLLRKSLSFNFLASILGCLFYVLLVYNFLVARPQILAMSFFISCLFLIFLYVEKNKNFLYLLLPITYLWANMHSSVVLGFLFSLVYSVYCFLSYKNTPEQKNWLRKTQMLLMYTVGMIVVSILPPQGFMQYKMLGVVIKESHLLQTYNAEWQSLSIDSSPFFFYSCLTIPLLAIGIWIWIKKRSRNFIFLLPIFLFLPYGYSAGRNLYYGYLGCAILFGWIVSQISLHTLMRKVIVGISIFFALFFTFFLTAETSLLIFNQPVFSPEATDFIQRTNLQGNMFNQFYSGGYLEYRLYPQQKVFADGRSDTSSCCKMLDYFNLLSAGPFYSEFKSNLKKFFNKYDISYAVLLVDNDGAEQLITPILTNDPSWSLVFWNHKAAIFVKKDGKNDEVIKKYHVTL